MALVAKYIEEAMPALDKEYGEDNSTLLKLKSILSIIREGEVNQKAKQAEEKKELK